MSSPSPMYTRHWQAVDPARNIARDYHLELSEDLFGWIIVERRWGRIGGQLKSAQNAFASAEEAQRFAAKVRARRSSSKQRIGAAYRPVA